MKQIYCKHYMKELRIKPVYTYQLINCELNLCKNCEEKLRKEISQQIEIEEALYG